MIDLGRQQKMEREAAVYESNTNVLKIRNTESQYDVTRARYASGHSWSSSWKHDVMPKNPTHMHVILSQISTHISETEEVFCPSTARRHRMT